LKKIDLNGALDFAGFNAAGANLHALGAGTYNGLNRLKIWQPTSSVMWVKV
jgi:hypothetical protein